MTTSPAQHFVPRPNSLAARVIAHFEQDPTPLRAKALCEMFGVLDRNLSVQLKSALHAEYLLRTGSANAVLYQLGPVRLVDAEPSVREAAAAAQAGQADQAPAQSSRGQRHPLAQGYHDRAEAERKAEAKAMGDFNCALWGDGDLLLYGLQINEDDISYTLNPTQVRRLANLLINGASPPLPL
jgi:hypothetical protein